MDKKDFVLKRLILFLILIVLVYPSLPIFISLIIKTRFVCDATDCSIEKNVLGQFTISNQSIGRNQITNFSIMTYRVGKGARIGTIYLNTRTGERYKMFAGSQKNAKSIYNKLNGLLEDKNIEITY